MLTPKINFAGTARDGTLLTTQLSLLHASFVNGLFVKDTDPELASNIFTVRWISEANKISGFPTSFTITTAWSVLLVAVSGYEMLGRVRCRSEDRRRIRAGFGGGGMEK